MSGVRTPGVCFGKPRIDGTHIPTDIVLENWEATDRSIAGVLNLWPQLTHEQVWAAIRYERRPARRLRRVVRERYPEFEGTVRWRGREWTW